MAADPTVDLFFYGTLRDSDVRRAVLGAGADGLDLIPARIWGYRCAPVAGGRYPILVPEPAARSDGVLITGVGLEAAARTSFFEDEGYDYRVSRIEVEPTAGPPRAAWAFLSSGRLTPAAGRWAIEAWRRRHRAAFVANARRAMAQCRGAVLERYWEGWLARLAGEEAGH
jgi:hypothetical protein